jgi:hypothetical protein
MKFEWIDLGINHEGFFKCLPPPLPPPDLPKLSWFSVHAGGLAVLRSPLSPKPDGKSVRLYAPADNPKGRSEAKRSTVTRLTRVTSLPRRTGLMSSFTPSIRHIRGGGEICRG